MRTRAHIHTRMHIRARTHAHTHVHARAFTHAHVRKISRQRMHSQARTQIYTPHTHTHTGLDLVAVFDGHGDAGHLASAFAADALPAAVVAHARNHRSVGSQLPDLVSDEITSMALAMQVLRERRFDTP
jgi:serine/threonine protein phosphatase PrpC